MRVKKIHYAIYICDNEIFFLDVLKEKIVKDKFKSLKEEQIQNSKLFVDEFSKFLKQNHIRISLFGDKICFIKNKSINPVILEKYEEVWQEYFHKIEYKDLDNILKIEKENGYLNITEHYLDYYFLKREEHQFLRIPLSLFNNNLRKAMHHIFTTIYKPKKLMVFGNVDNISKIAEEIRNNYNINTTFPEVYYQYVFEEYKK